MNDLKAFQTYIQSIQNNMAMGNATEHTHRPTLKSLVQELAEGVIATNEPKRIECGAPDFIINKGVLTIGYIEAKDINKSLDETEKHDQLKRYRESLSNLVLTDYIEFRWYVDGERRLVARLGTVTGEGKIKPDKEGVHNVSELLIGFLSHKAVSVGKPKDLAVRMARLAHMIRNLIINTFEKEPNAGSLHSQLAAFRENLIPDLAIEPFADMYAQTIAYGLFAARCTVQTGSTFTRFDAAQNLPKTNPFLRQLFQYIAGYDLDDRIAWLVDDLAQVMAQADMAAVLEDFGKHTGKDPVVHFYETFLKAYDPAVREMRGVYYTPEPVVSYIVRSVDYLLKKHFDKPQGLVDSGVLILDPAVGTATFLYKVINEIHDNLIKRGQQGLWNDYVAQNLLPRLFGFEILMAPYAIAHLKLGLLLQETGYKFQSDQRLGIYLTNTLEESFKKAEQLAGFNEYIVDEANAAAEIKKEKPIMVILGNPPYSVSSANKSDYIEKLMELYKTSVRIEHNIQPLSDDYIKFIRFAHDRIERTGYGIIGMITNNAYLTGLIHRGIREELLKAFDDIYILDLHGNSLIGDTTLDGGPDKNVFEIRQGVAISLFIRKLKHKEFCQFHYSEFLGTRESKYDRLLDNDVNTIQWQEFNPSETPNFFFVPKRFELHNEYDKAWSVTKIFGTGNPQKDQGKRWGYAIKTNRDALLIDIDRDVLEARIQLLANTEISDSEIETRYNLKNSDYWSTTRERQKIRNENWHSNVILYLHRPFDKRWLLYQPNLIEIGRGGAGKSVMHHMIAGKNIGLCTNREVNGNFRHILCTRQIVSDCTVSLKTRERTYLFPLYLYPSKDELQFDMSPRANLNPEFVKLVSEEIGLKFVENGKGDLQDAFGPEDIFNYAYAVFHSPTYRTRYAEFLKIDFPRLPLTLNRELFQALAKKGAELVSLHLMESPLLDTLITTYPVSGTNTVDKVNYDEKKLRVYVNKEQYFEGLSPCVWNFQIGGYQVCEKWLKDRQKTHRKLSVDDINHYQKIVIALKETIRLMEEIDSVIPQWPIN